MSTNVDLENQDEILRNIDNKRKNQDEIPIQEKREKVEHVDKTTKKLSVDVSDSKLELLESFGTNSTPFGIIVLKLIIFVFGATAAYPLHSQNDFGYVSGLFHILKQSDVKNPKNLIKAFKFIATEQNQTSTDFKDKCRKLNLMLEGHFKLSI